MDHGLPPNALAANWDPEILADYMASVERAHADSGGDSEDDAMSTDSDGDDTGDAPSSPPTSHASVPAHMRAVDIASDDDAFSSEDEFASETSSAKQRARRELVLGRPPHTVLEARAKELADMHEEYLRQLDFADDELAELKGVPRVALVRRDTILGYNAPVALDGETEVVVRELRMRSRKEIVETEKDDSVRGLVLLAQAQFRKEREIKHLYGPTQVEDDEYDGDVSFP